MILPAKYLPDIRGAGRDHLAFVDSISDILFLYNWVGDLFKSSRMVFAGKPIFCLYGLRGWFSRVSAKPITPRRGWPMMLNLFSFPE